MIVNETLLVGLFAIILISALKLDKKGFIRKTKRYYFDDYYFQTEIRNRYLKRHLPDVLDFNFKLSLDKSYIQRENDGSLKRIFRGDA